MTATAEQTTSLVVDFLNTIDVEAGTDALTDPRVAARWCRDRRLSAGDPVVLRRLRDSLRILVAGGRAHVPAIAVPIRADPDGGLRLSPTNACGAIAAAVGTITASGWWHRLKLCPADDCRRAFYDLSRNSSRVWCDMSDCGNLAKVRAYRGRRTAP